MAGEADLAQRALQQLERARLARRDAIAAHQLARELKRIDFLDLCHPNSTAAAPDLGRALISDVVIG